MVLRYSLLPPIPAYTPVRLPFRLAGSIPPSSSACQLVSSSMRCWGSIMRASIGLIRKKPASNRSMPSTNAPTRLLGSGLAGSPKAPFQGPGSGRPSVTAFSPASSWRQKLCRSGAPGNRHAIPTMAMPLLAGGPGAGTRAAGRADSSGRSVSGATAPPASLGAGGVASAGACMAKRPSAPPSKASMPPASASSDARWAARLPMLG